MKMRPSLFKNVSAREILFDGFSDPLLTVGSLFARPGSNSLAILYLTFLHIL